MHFFLQLTMPTNLVAHALGVLQLSGRTQLSVEAGLRVLSAAGRQNYNSRRTVEVTITDPAGAVIYSVFNTWQEATISLPSSQLGTFHMWCALACAASVRHSCKRCIAKGCARS